MFNYIETFGGSVYEERTTRQQRNGREHKTVPEPSKCNRIRKAKYTRHFVQLTTHVDFNARENNRRHIHCPTIFDTVDLYAIGLSFAEVVDLYNIGRSFGESVALHYCFAKQFFIAQCHLKGYVLHRQESSRSSIPLVFSRGLRVSSFCFYRTSFVGLFLWIVIHCF